MTAKADGFAPIERAAAAGSDGPAAGPFAITMGDPAGIGPEIILKAFEQAPSVTRGCFVAGDLAALRRASRLVAPHGIPLPIALISTPAQVADVPPRCVPALQATEGDALVPWGRIDATAGRMAADCVVWAARAALRGEIAAMVTAPLHKEALAAAGVPFPGHTELLQAEAAAFLGGSAAQLPVRMMLANREIRTVLVSIHMSLREAIEAVTFDNVLQTLLITHRSLGSTLGRPPRIAVAGLNPHAGEGGLFGREEIAVIAPAVSAARGQGVDASGPFAPDTVFMRARSAPGHEGEFDVVVAMYHDQGLIPVKYLGVDQGVNVTLGLPLVRTSPDHGTAFDIAGSGRADPSSLVEAIRVARQLASHHGDVAAGISAGIS
jgi:4-hydroxythreonine-4-phosphate dehydrogenase